MQNYFTERWKTDLGGPASSEREKDVPHVLAGWASDSECWTAARRLKPAERREILETLGRKTYDTNAGQFKTELLWNTHDLDYIWRARERARMLRRHTELLFASLSDIVELSTAGERQKALEQVSFVNKDILTAAQANGRGVILFGVYQCNPRFLFEQPFLADRTIGVIRHDGAGDGSSLLFEHVPPNVRILPASIRAVRSILDLLFNGQIVCYYNDFLYPGSAPALSTLFGKPVLIARAILSIALKTRSTIIPVSIVRTENEGVVVEMFPAIDSQLENGSPLEERNLLALQIGVATECLIRRHPSNWRLWNTLQHRWKHAEVHISQNNSGGNYAKEEERLAAAVCRS